MANNVNLNGDTTPNSITSTSAATTANGDLIFGVAVEDSGVDTISAGGGFSPRVVVNNGSDNPMLAEDMMQGAAGSVAATFTLASGASYQAHMVAFRAAGSTGGAGASPAITSATSASGTEGTAFSYQITATNNPTSFNATGLPAGLSVDTSSGLISGTPTGTGTYSVTLSATNSSGTGTGTLTLTVGPVSSAPVITSASSATGTVGTSFKYQITATNNPTSFDATGLPSGLTVNRSSGVISGTPATSGTFSVTLSASNAGGTGNSKLALTISSHHHHEWR
jgi:hypothetical protein